MSVRADLCDRCGVEVATRVDVMRMIGGMSRYGGDHVWRAHSCGESYAYGHFARPFVGAGFAAEEAVSVVKPMCMCEHYEKKSAVQVLIREDHQQVFLDKFGPNMALSLLFRLPRGVVAWQNLGLVGVVSRGGHLFLSREGESLLQIVRDAHAAGCFDASFATADAEVLQAYTYLYLLKAKYRGVVAGKYGPRVLMAKLFEEVPVDWFDWVSMSSLNFCVKPGGGVVIGKLPGTPVSDTLYSMFVKRIVEAKRVVPDAHVVQGGTCVQFMPHKDDDDGSFTMFDSPSVVALAAGVSFLSTGKTVLSGSQMAVTFEPGIELVTPKGHVIVGGDQGITVFIEGQVSVDIVDTGTPVSYGVRSQFAVPIVCDDYGPRTKLGRWHRRQFDVLSTDARFMASLAEFVVLGARPNHSLHDLAAGVDTVNVHPGVSTSRRHGDAAVGRMYDVGPDICVIDTDQGHTDLDVNGRVKLRGEGGVGFVNHPYVQLDSHVYGSVEKAHMEMYVHVVEDAYIVDRGGPSGSDGEFFNEVNTYVEAPGLGYLSACLRGNGDGYRKGVSHLLIAKDPMNSLHMFGDHVAWKRLLSAPANMFDIDAFQVTGLKRDKWFVGIVPLVEAQASWADFWKSAVHWHDVRDDAKDLASVLDKLYASEVPRFVVRPHDSCANTFLLPGRESCEQARGGRDGSGFESHCAVADRSS